MSWLRPGSRTFPKTERQVEQAQQLAVTLDETARLLAQFGPWRKSSYSGDEGNRVELAWRKSSHSGDCVELAHTETSGAIRDSKNPDGGHLEVPLAGLIAIAKSL